MKIDYPELEKVRAVKDKSQIIGEFLEWLMSKGFTIERDGLSFAEPSFNRMLAQFFEIDLAKVEEEKRLILERIRKMEEAADLIFGSNPTVLESLVLSEAEASVALDRGEVGTFSVDEMPSHGDKGE